MRSCSRVSTMAVGIAATLVAGAAAAQTIHPTLRVTLAGRAAFPRPTGATLGPGVTRPSGAVLGPGVTRPTGATPGPGVRRAVGAIPGPDVTRATGATPGPGVRRATGAVLGPGVERPSGATLGSGVRRPTGATLGPDVTRPTGAAPGPGVRRAVGAIPGPNVERPVGATPSGRDVVRPTGPTFGFTFRPLFQPPFRAGDRFPRNEALHAGRERGDLSTEAPALPRVGRPDLLTDAPALPRVERPDLLTDAPAPPRIERPDLSTELPAPPRRERTDLSTDERTFLLPEELVSAPIGMGLRGIVGGTFTGGVVGTPYSWLFGADWLGAWRLFNLSDYRAGRFAPEPPVRRWRPLRDQAWIVSGRASIGPDWSILRDRAAWTVSGRAGYGPEWSVLRE